MSSTTITPAECSRLLKLGRSLNLLDVRTPAEFDRVHAAGATLMPLDELDVAAAFAQRRDANEPIYILCQSGARAAKACQRFREAGIEQAFCVEGGTAAWEQAGLPVDRAGGKVISLERQVRIAAGLLVFIGSILAWRVHPGFLAVPIFVGAGLAFAGITDTCGMAMLLAKMPWNRGKSGKAVSCAKAM